MSRTAFFLLLCIAVGMLGYYFVHYLAQRTDMGPLRERTRSLCESTGGTFLNCNAATSIWCGAPMGFNGIPYACACPERARWDVQRGCSRE